jgi:branched-chain amino acid transport system substrate-binding protein
MKPLLIKSGLEVLGGVRPPPSSTDFASSALQVKASNADAVVVTFGGAPTIRAVQALRDFGVKSEIVAPSIFIQDIKGIGLETGQGIIFTDSFYWDQTDETRAWSKRYFEVMKKMPSSIHAAVYTQVSHYLKAVKAAGTTNADNVMEKVREIPINDFMTKDGHVEINGQVIRDRPIWKIKAPSESKGDWDLQKLLLTVPGKQASFAPEDSGCPLVKKK